MAFAESAESGSQDRQGLGRRAVGKKGVSERYLERAARSISGPPKLTSVNADSSFQNMWPVELKHRTEGKWSVHRMSSYDKYTSESAMKGSFKGAQIVWNKAGLSSCT